MIQHGDIVIEEQKDACLCGFRAHIAHRRKVKWRRMLDHAGARGGRNPLQETNRGRRRTAVVDDHGFEARIIGLVLQSGKAFGQQLGAVARRDDDGDLGPLRRVVTSIGPAPYPNSSSNRTTGRWPLAMVENSSDMADRGPRNNPGRSSIAASSSVTSWRNRFCVTKRDRTNVRRPT